MCGRFTAMASWSAVDAFSEPLTFGRSSSGQNDQELTFKVMSNLPLLILDPVSRKRRIVSARWGFPHPQDWQRPQPIHAYSETIEVTPAFARAFLDGQRGIVLASAFDEMAESGEQLRVTPNIPKSGIAFIWRRFEVGPPQPLIACAMVTVRANKQLAALQGERMPALLDSTQWAKWLGEEPASMDKLKSYLKTVEGPNWTLRRERPDVATVGVADDPTLH
jgi:putative SOS response-associated peptidase YedK